MTVSCDICMHPCHFLFIKTLWLEKSNYTENDANLFWSAWSCDVIIRKPNLNAKIQQYENQNKERKIRYTKKENNFCSLGILLIQPLISQMNKLNAKLSITYSFALETFCGHTVTSAIC